MPKYKTAKQALAEAGYSPKMGQPKRFDEQLPGIRITSDLATRITVDCIKQKIPLQQWRRDAYERLLTIREIEKEQNDNR